MPKKSPKDKTKTGSQKLRKQKTKLPVTTEKPSGTKLVNKIVTDQISDDSGEANCSVTEINKADNLANISTQSGTTKKKKKQKKKLKAGVAQNIESIDVDIHQKYTVSTDKISDDENKNISISNLSPSKLEKQKSDENKPLKKKKKKKVPNKTIISGEKNVAISTAQISDDEIVQMDVADQGINVSRSAEEQPVDLDAVTILEHTAFAKSELSAVPQIKSDVKGDILNPPDNELEQQISDTRKEPLTAGGEQKRLVVPKYSEFSDQADAIPLLGETPKKRPAALDFLEDSNETPDTQNSNDQPTVTETSSKRVKRAKATDFVDETEDCDPTTSASVPNLHEFAKAVPGSVKNKPDLVLNEEDVGQKEEDEEQEEEDEEQDEEEEETNEEPEPDLLGGGAPFLGYDNFDVYSNNLLPHGNYISLRL